MDGWSKNIGWHEGLFFFSFSRLFSLNHYIFIMFYAQFRKFERMLLQCNLSSWIESWQSTKSIESTKSTELKMGSSSTNILTQFFLICCRLPIATHNTVEGCMWPASCSFPILALFPDWVSSLLESKENDWFLSLKGHLYHCLQPSWITRQVVTFTLFNLKFAWYNVKWRCFEPGKDCNIGT